MMMMTMVACVRGAVGDGARGRGAPASTCAFWLGQVFKKGFF